MLSTRFIALVVTSIVTLAATTPAIAAPEADGVLIACQDANFGATCNAIAFVENSCTQLPPSQVNQVDSVEVPAGWTRIFYDTKSNTPCNSDDPNTTLFAPGSTNLGLQNFRDSWTPSSASSSVRKGRPVSRVTATSRLSFGVRRSNPQRRRKDSTDDSSGLALRTPLASRTTGHEGAYWGAISSPSSDWSSGIDNAARRAGEEGGKGKVQIRRTEWGKATICTYASYASYADAYVNTS
ncbi:hypothetical protein C8R45DRAFT_1104028 [Mycena sanguinolenta]|nr:hypothetical protein C8R45DRAFT_1104028 [Mycena sanguinolenta]